MHVANNQTSQISALAVIAESGLFDSDRRKSSSPSLVAFASQDGNVRVMEWHLGDFGHNAFGEKPRTPYIRDQSIDLFIPGDGVNYITSLIVASSRIFLIAGTKSGDVRLYKWSSSLQPNQSALAPVFNEFKAHSSRVVDIKETPTGEIVSVGEDGSIFLWNLSDPEPPAEDIAESLYSANESIASEAEAWTYNTNLVCVSAEDIEDNITMLDSLTKQLADAESKFDYTVRKLENDHAEKFRSLVNDHLQVLNAEKKKYETLYEAFNEKVKEMKSKEESKDLEHVKIVVDLENKFEKKLSEQLERYDALSEEMEVMVQRNRVIKEQLERKHLEQMESSKSKYEDQLRKFHADIKRIKEERASDEKAFKEILDQQEYEYEEELKTLIAASAQKLKEEKDAHDTIKELTKSKLAKSKNVAEKLKESSQSQKVLEAKLASERKKAQTLNATIAHYQSNLKEREEALAEKEKTILELRNNIKILENFRFVLDHRLQLLTAERGPITSHIEGLEKHVTAMYEELVGEFEGKKVMQVQSDQKDKRLLVVSSEVTKLRDEVKDREELIAAFKRELGNIISANCAPKEFEEATKLLYRKYVVGDAIKGDILRPSTLVLGQAIAQSERPYDNNDDDDIEFQNETGVNFSSNGKSVISQYNIWLMGFLLDQPKSRRMKSEIEADLLENAKEADRRRNFVETNAKNLKHRLDASRRQAEFENKVRLAENSSLMYECNDLRFQVKELERRLQIAEALIESKAKARSPKLNAKTLTSTFPRVNDDAAIDEVPKMSASVDRLLDIKANPIRPPPSVVETLGDSMDGTHDPRKTLPKLITDATRRRGVGDKEKASEKVVRRLRKELESLVLQLEEVHKEKDFYCSEMNKLRQQVSRYSQPDERVRGLATNDTSSPGGMQPAPLKASLSPSFSPFFEDRRDAASERAMRVIGTIPNSKRQMT